MEPISVTERLPKFEDSSKFPEEVVWWWRVEKGDEDFGVWELLVFDFQVKHYNESDSIYCYTHWLPYSEISHPKPIPSP